MKVFAKTQILTEEPFLRRELDLAIQYVESFQQLYPLTHSTYNLALSSVGGLDDVLEISRFPDQSVNLFLFGNESYDSEYFSIWEGVKSVRVIFTTFPFQFENILTLLFIGVGACFDGFAENPRDAIQLLRDLRTNYRKRKLFRNLGSRLNLEILPLGYSRSFEFQFREYFHAQHRISNSWSIIDKLPLRGFFPIDDKCLRFSFLGQRGNESRSRVVELTLHSYPESSITLKDEWGGNNSISDNSYLNSYRDNVFQLVPPGGFAHINHRFYESIIMGSIPVTTRIRTVDSSRQLLSTQNIFGLSQYSWKLLLNHLSSFSKDEIHSFYSYARLCLIEDIKSSRQRVNDYN